MREADRGWLAGIIDGEGCFTLRALKSKTNYGTRWRFCPQLTVCNCNRKIVEKCRAIVGRGRILTRVRRNPRASPQHCWEIYATGLRELLPKIIGISMKAGEIRLIERALEITGRPHEGWKGYWGRKPLDYQQLTELNEIRTKLVSLHGRQAVSLRHVEITPFDLSPRPELKEAWRKARAGIKLRDIK